MKLLDLFFKKGYSKHPDSVIISCYFNPTGSKYRKKVFDQYYETIKHLDHRIIECIIGDGPSELTQVKNLEIVRTDHVLWHKESLLNKLIFSLPEKYKYVFWIDADVIFSNKNWLVDGCKELETYQVVQPFEYCVHLDKDQVEPDSGTRLFLENEFAWTSPKQASKYKIWRSFGANVITNPQYARNNDYDIHGHVGFAWGARLDYLKSIGGLFDKALVGGADHIMAHAFIGQIPCECITKSFGDLREIEDWSKSAFYNTGGSILSGISYAQGNLYHLWHGDIEKRQYLKRIQEFQPKVNQIQHRDDNGLFVTDDDSYVRDYFIFREVTDHISSLDGISIADLPGSTDSLFTSEQPYENQDVDPGQFEGGQFEGGQFGGSGAGADWDDNVVTENFS